MRARSAFLPLCLMRAAWCSLIWLSQTDLYREAPLNALLSESLHQTSSGLRSPRCWSTSDCLLDPASQSNQQAVKDCQKSSH